MKKDHDIYSGLGLSDTPKKAKAKENNTGTITDATTSGNEQPSNSMDDNNANEAEVEKGQSACCSHEDHEGNECSHIHNESPNNNNNVSTEKSESTEDVELDQLAKDLARAEMIFESFEGVKVFLLFYFFICELL